MEIQNQNEESENQPESEKNEEFKPKVSKLDEIFDNILYEKPKLDDPSILEKTITLEENLCILALI